ncbi:protein-disulfide reductase DsbD [Thioalkalivibrio sp. HK1]|uniref:protein-disulfide reductase DsbD n=1 Tax=Thioalkalivibrio sp. HK1 TaxID=1469245 RepID=UPI00046FE903|nr:protein-disulfide reductase DsbD [Thioalkalivibrio sp. HK1]
MHRSHLIGLSNTAKALAAAILLSWGAPGAKAQLFQQDLFQQDSQEAGSPAQSPVPRENALDRISPGLIDLLEGGALATDDDEPEFLDPDIAFVPTITAPTPDRIEVHWEIAEGYYLYRDKMSFGASDIQGADEKANFALGSPRFPAGEIKDDEYFGRMEVYYDSVRVDFPFAGEPGLVDLDISYQGCAEAGLCYPPITRSLPVLIPVAGDDAGSGTSSDGIDSPSRSVPSGEMSEQDRIASALLSGNPWLVMLSLFGAGLLLAFTPCVLPMVPILSSIIVGQGKGIGTRRAFTLSSVYVLAMASTYTVAGVLAGMAGANFTVAFQDPWILVPFALLFALLSLAMFGLYELQIPAALQDRLSALSRRQRGGSFVGVGVMGVLSALIVGPCVAAPLAGVLLYIGRTGDPLFGGMALFSLSLGMGAPLLVAGTSAGKLLPAVGPWMKRINAIFGVMLLAVAIYLLDRVLPPAVILLLWAALLITCSIYMGALDGLAPDTGGWRRLWKGAGLFSLVYGILLMVGVATGKGDLFEPLKGLTLAEGESSDHALPFRLVKGTQGLDAELVQAAAQGQTTMLDFYADWCVSCKEMERFTFSDAGVQRALGDMRILQTDVTANDERDQTLLKRFELFGPPAILFFDPDGRERRELRVVGFMSADEFGEIVARARPLPAGERIQSRSSSAPIDGGLFEVGDASPRALSNIR